MGVVDLSQVYKDATIISEFIFIKFIKVPQWFFGCELTPPVIDLVDGLLQRPFYWSVLDCGETVNRPCCVSLLNQRPQAMFFG